MILLDTHILVRWVDPQAKPLPPSLVDYIEQADARAVSAITCWEIAWLVRKDRLQLGTDLNSWLDEALAGSGVRCLPIDRPIATLSANLTLHHRDPADRLIIATACIHDLGLVSLDSQFSDYVELAGRLVSN